MSHKIKAVLIEIICAHPPAVRHPLTSCQSLRLFPEGTVTVHSSGSSAIGSKNAPWKDQHVTKVANKCIRVVAAHMRSKRVSFRCAS